MWGGLQEDTPRAFENGARYDLSSEDWTTLSAGPLAPRSRHVGVWTGSEVIYWGGIAGDGDEPETVVSLSDGAAYEPATDAWRMLPESPLEGGSRTAGVWTGEELVVVGAEEDDVASYDPATDSWILLPPRPEQGHSTDWISVFWVGEEVIVVASDPEEVSVDAYDPETDAWRVMRPTPFESMEMSVTSGSPTHAMHDSTIWLSGFAPQEVGVVGLDTDTDEWVTSSPFPGRDCTDVPSAIETSLGVVLDSCGVTAILASTDSWEEIPTLPRTLLIPGPDPIWTGGALVLLEPGIEPGAVNFPDGAEPHFWILHLAETGG